MIDAALESAIRASWAAATVANDNIWDATNPAAGHCDVTSLVIREQRGGDLWMGHVFREGALSEHHYWNVLPDGSEIDLTGEQFDGSETIEPVVLMTAEFFAQAGPMKPELRRRLAAFRSAVNTELNGSGPERPR